MAVNVDTVYQRVLTLANKEQRGYITPQEFNLLANQAQMDIFEQYFYDINQFGRLPGNNTEYSDMLNILEEKISEFESSKDISYNETHGFYNISGNIGKLYRIGSIIYNHNGEDVICEQVNNKDISVINKSPLLKPESRRPVYVLKKGRAYIYPDIIKDTITVNYIREPEKVVWTYNPTVTTPLYDPFQPGAQDFELHPSEETDLVNKILILVGISMKNDLYQIGTREDIKDVQQEKR